MSTLARVAPLDKIYKYRFYLRKKELRELLKVEKWTLYYGGGGSEVKKNFLFYA